MKCSQPRMQKYDELVQNGIKNPCVHLTQMKGYFRCCVYKWKGPRARQHWSLICAAAPRIAKKVKEVPNTLRAMLGLEKKFKSRGGGGKAPSETSMVPAALENVVADLVVPCSGFSRCTSLSMCIYILYIYTH